MILLTSPAKPLSFTPKGTPRRKTILDDYDTEINALYDTVESSIEAGGLALTSFSDFDVTSFIRETVRDVMKGAVEDTDDLFQHGCDRCVLSLSARTVTDCMIASKRPGSETKLPVRCVALTGKQRHSFLPILSSSSPASLG